MISTKRRLSPNDFKSFVELVFRIEPSLRIKIEEILSLFPLEKVMSQSQKQELVEKVSRLVVEQFSGDYLQAFAHYDRDADGRINKSDLGRLLRDAGIASWISRGFWASAIIDAIDSNKDGTISREEFEAMFTYKDEV